jgi:hypothetical protein
MKASVKLLSLGLIILITSYACKKDRENDLMKEFTVNGFIQKGPFIQGSEVRLQILNNDVVPTGTVFYTQTSDDFGSFLLDINTDMQYLDISTTGFYFNEITGQLSNSFISLLAFSNPSEDRNINVNILTSLEYGRIAYLIKNQNLSFEEARRQAEQEVLLIFNIDLSAIGDIDLIPFEELDISKGSINDAILIAISSILQYNNSEAELSELTSKISDDIKDDGTLDNASIRNEIAENSMQLNPDSIRTNLINRYNALGIQIQVANFEGFIDHDGNGLIDLFQASAPIISPEPVMIHSDPILITITASPGDEIYYTLDGTVPTNHSLLYTAPFYIGLDGQTTTISAISYSETLEPSPVSTFTYRFRFQEAFSPKYNIYAGTYNHDISLELFSETNDAVIYYTLDGSDPDSNSIQYTEPICISGDGTIVLIKAITLHKYLKESIMSSSYYNIDYKYNPDIYLDTLDLNAYRKSITGKWIGHVTTPWTGPYNVQIEFFDNERFSAYTLSAYKFPYGDEIVNPPFNHGTEGYSDSNRIYIYDIYTDGKALASISLYVNPSTIIRGSLNYISFVSDLNNLTFEFWQDEYGPLTYYLTRLIE